MKQHPDINWSEVIRQAIQEKIETLEVMAELTSGSELTECAVADIANKTTRAHASASKRSQSSPDK